MIIIQPIGGLCNRMRAINSARVLAKKRGETLKVIWNVNPNWAVLSRSFSKKLTPSAFVISIPNGIRKRSFTSSRAWWLETRNFGQTAQNRDYRMLI